MADAMLALRRGRTIHACRRHRHRRAREPRAGRRGARSLCAPARRHPHLRRRSAAPRYDRRSADRQYRCRVQGSRPCLAQGSRRRRAARPRSRGGAGERTRSVAAGRRRRLLPGPTGHRDRGAGAPGYPMTAATAVDIRDAVRAGRQSAREVCQQALDRISAVESQLHAFNTVVAERALERAAAGDRARDRWRDAPLLGVPVALKDNLCTRDVRTTASSKILEQYVPPYDATAVARLEAAGAIVVGKTNCDEFAMGSSNENSAFGPVRNLWATDRIPGV